MIYLTIASIATSVLLAIAGGAWIYVTRWELLRRMSEIQRSDTAIIEVKTRMDALERKPEAGAEEIKKLYLRFEGIDSNIRILKATIENEAEILRKGLSKLNARQTRAADPEREEEKATGSASGKSGEPSFLLPGADALAPQPVNGKLSATFGKTLTGRG